MRILSIFLFVMMLAGSACGPSYYYDEQFTINDARWAYTDTIEFNFDIADTTASYDLMLDVEHSTAYAYQNIYIKIFTTFPDGTFLEQEVPIDFADSKGTWYGKCASSICDLRVILQEGAHFNQGGKYQLSIVQFMRVDPLPGISAIAVKLDKQQDI